jgi:dihydroflavonol-4-reductase
VLVTGSTGFIGSNLCRALIERGEAVRALHRAASPLTLLEGLPVEHVIGDITVPETLRPAMGGVKTVYHAAAQLGKTPEPGEIIRVAAGGTRNVLRAAAEAGVSRVVHTSSVAALGVPRRPRGAPIQPLDENHTWNERPGRWRYGYAKYQAELAVQEAVAGGLEVVIVNPAVVIGAGDLNRISGRVILEVARGRVPVAVKGGLNIVHIQDVVAGHLAAMEKGAVGERYILGGVNLTHTRLIEIIAEQTGARPPLATLPGLPLRLLAGPLSRLDDWLHLPISGDSFHRAGVYFYYDNSKARRELNLGEPLPPETAVRDAVEWYRARAEI